MRKSMGLALGLALLLGASARAQSTSTIPTASTESGPGFFGFMPKLFGTTPAGTDPASFTIPNQTLPGFSVLGLFPAKSHSPIGSLTHAVTNIPTYSPLMPQSYLNAFHYRPPAPLPH